MKPARIRVAIEVESEDVEVPAVLAELERVLRDTFARLHEDGRYADVKVIGPMVIRAA
jgi:hypothetical protein